MMYNNLMYIYAKNASIMSADSCEILLYKGLVKPYVYSVYHSETVLTDNKKEQE